MPTSRPIRNLSNISNSTRLGITKNDIKSPSESASAVRYKTNVRS